MKIIRGLKNLQTKHQNCALSIGKFDGVHLGHQKLFKNMVNYAKTHHIPSIVMIFEPSPSDFFQQKKTPKLSPFADKISRILDCGINYILILPFNQQIAQLSADNFVKHYLIEKLRVKKLWVGDDFRFGKNRQGNFEFLKNLSQTSNFYLSNIETVCFEKKRISSSHIRTIIQQGKIEIANQMLGQPLSLSGRVIEGQKLGRQLGFPTANIYLNDSLKNTISLLPKGVYLVKLKSKKKQKDLNWGVANIGYKPTVLGSKLSFEIHCLNFSGNLYKQKLRIEIINHLRSEKKFNSLEDLTKQITLDIEQAKAMIKKQNC